MDMYLESLIMGYGAIVLISLGLGAAILYRILERLEEQCDMLHTLAAFLLAKQERYKRKDK